MARFRKIPFKFCVASILLCWFMKETYPFSHFPMYSSQHSMVSCLYLTDGHDNILPTMTTLGQTSPMLSKFLVGWHKRMKIKGSMIMESLYHPYAAEETLVRFYAISKNKTHLDSIAPIKLWEHHIRLLPNNTLFELKQVIAVVNKGGLPPPELPDIGKGIFVPEFDWFKLRKNRKMLAGKKGKSRKKSWNNQREKFLEEARERRLGDMAVASEHSEPVLIETEEVGEIEAGIQMET